MAATKGKLTKLQQDQTRLAIKTSQLVNRLQAFALGEKETHAPEGEEAKLIELDANRLRAIDILLKKSLPDLSAVTISGDDDKDPIRVEGAASKVLAHLNAIEERSGTTSSPDAV